VGETLQERAFLTAEDGLICLGTLVAQTDDQICIILGCSVPLLLRPNPNGQYRIVGSCYVHGLMDGESLLGPLPTCYKSIYQFDSSSGLVGHAFLNHQTDEIQTEDPRLGPLPENWQRQTHKDEKFWTLFYNEKTGDGKESSDAPDPRLTTKALKELGVNLVDIQLV